MNECRGHASKVQAIVDSYKHANRSIQALCKRISESLLVSIDSKRIYESNEVSGCYLVLVLVLVTVLVMVLMWN